MTRKRKRVSQKRTKRTMKRRTHSTGFNIIFDVRDLRFGGGYYKRSRYRRRRSIHGRKRNVRK